MIYYGYRYNEEGRFIEIIPLEEKPIYEKQTFYREETKEIVTEEKLCELHQSIEDGTYKPDPENVEESISKYECPDCVMKKVDYETIKVPYEENVVIGYEPDIPENCTLEVCPDLIYAPIFNGENWVKTVEPKTEEPEPQPEGATNLEVVKHKQVLMEKALDELLLGGM
ncbi:TPA: hypothetical protein ACJMKN_002195 [Bacillus cereus]